MERVEYTTNGNEIGASIKYPNSTEGKWSEHHTMIKCECCESENISSDKSADLLVITCHDCNNFWYGSVDKVICTSRALVQLWRIPFVRTGTALL